MKFAPLTLIVMLFTAALVAQEKTAADADETGIVPPADLNIQPPAPQPEAIPAPSGQRDGRLELGRDLDLGELREQIGPEGRQFLRRSGDRGITFGLDMAERGISFGLRYANGQAGPADAKAFGIDMGRRGKAFGLEMRDRSLDFTEETIDGAKKNLPVDGRDAKFNETPGDITIDAPPIPLGASAPSPVPEAKVFGRQPQDREVKFRREF